MSDVAYTDEFEAWWDSLDEADQDAVQFSVSLLRQFGVTLGHPHSSAIKGSKHPLRELRCQSSGRPLRVFYAYNPVRDAVMIVGGDKTGDDRFYKRAVRTAEDLWDQYLAEKAWEREPDDD
jgi:hypothetical protein